MPNPTLPRPIRATFALIMREMATSYGRSTLGYLWVLLEPIGRILFLTLILSIFLRAPPIGDSFVLFYATGFIPFGAYVRLQAVTANVFTANRRLLFYPEVSYIDAILARFILNGLTQGLVAAIVLVTVIVAFDLQVNTNVGYAALSMLLAVLLGSSVGTINCVLNDIFPSWPAIWSVINVPLFIASGIIFLYDQMPVLAQEILWYNPLIHIVGLMRAAIYGSYDGAYISIAYVCLFAGTCFLVGLLALRRLSKDMLNI